MPSPSRIALTLAVVSVLAGACSPRANRPTPKREVTTVEVVNHRWENLDVYLERDGSLYRLGRVWGLDRAVLRIPSSLHGGGDDVALHAGSFGGPLDAWSGSFQLLPGDKVVWRVERNTAPVRVNRN